MNSRLNILIIVLALVFINSGMAQDMPPARPEPQTNQEQKQKQEFLQRISLGGYLGVQFGTITNVEITPIVTYEVATPFYVGVGFTYMYYRDKRYYPEYSSSGIGGRLFARYHIWQDLFVQAEYDPLNLSYYDYYYDNAGNLIRGPKSNTWVHDLLVGAGYRQWIGGRAFATLVIFWNVNESLYSPYRNPIIRIGFGVGL
jgi:hypothetical protein